MKPKSLMVLAMFAFGACAHDPQGCQTSLTSVDVTAAMGEGVAAQPVYAESSVKGWRIYNTHRSAQLTAQGIVSGTLMTHVCGIPVREISAKGGNICCKVDASREVEVTFQVADHERKIKIKRQT